VENKLHWADRPLWVRYCLVWVRSRTAALAWMWVGIAGGLVLLALWAIGLAFWLALPLWLALPPAPFAGFLYILTLGLVGAVWSLSDALLRWLTIQWVDEHDGWAHLRPGKDRQGSTVRS
jgi:hypothetical protein